MPQLVPYYFSNQIIIIITTTVLILHYLSRYVLPRFPRNSLLRSMLVVI